MTYLPPCEQEPPWLSSSLQWNYLPYQTLGMDVMTWELMYVWWLKTAKVFNTVIPSKVHGIYVV
jgi:hypothetical protein